MAKADKVLRIGAVGDIHCTRTSQGTLEGFFGEVPPLADALVLCGDLTDHGLPEEALVLVKELGALGKIPIIAVLGNHDFESEQQEEVRDILAAAGIHLLDGDAWEMRGIGFAGIKGFAGGFGRGTLQAWGEPVVKSFVREAQQETVKLENALARLRTEQRIAILHYAPIQATVEGEPVEIYPFLGSSRHEEPIDRFLVTAVVHGHAHRGSPEGKTRAGIRVYNVALPLLRRVFPDRPPLRIIEVPLSEAR